MIKNKKNKKNNWPRHPSSSSAVQPSLHSSHPLGPASEQVSLHDMWQTENKDYLHF